MLLSAPTLGPSPELKKKSLSLPPGTWSHPDTPWRASLPSRWEKLCSAVLLVHLAAFLSQEEDPVLPLPRENVPFSGEITWSQG